MLIFGCETITMLYFSVSEWNRG